MNISTDIVLGLLTALSMFIGFVVWLVRLEAKTQSHDKDLIRHEREDEILHKKIENRIERLAGRHDDLEDRLFEKLSNIERILTERLAKIEGKLEVE